jgi:hypothetical protein
MWFVGAATGNDDSEHSSATSTHRPCSVSARSLYEEGALWVR